MEPNKFITSRIILNATIPFEWEQKPILVKLNEEVVNRIKMRKEELGLSDILS